jgi:tudor domain-containing protein 1/4/6/7
MQSDTNWYRGKVLQVKNETCRVLNLEYGNVEILHKSCLRELDVQFSKVQSLITRAYFGIKSTETSESNLLSEIRASLTEGLLELNFEIVKKFKDGLMLEVFDAKSKENFFDKLVARKLAVRISENELEKILKEKSEILENFEEIIFSPDSTKPVENLIAEKEETIPKSQEEVKANSKIPGKITALTSPNDFYLFSVEDMENYKVMQDDIQILAPALPPLLDFECTTLCLAQQPFDNLWYRAKIIDSDETIITVVCVDNGKTFSIDNKIFLKVLPEQLQRKIFFGISSSLTLSIEYTCEENATQLMLQYVDTEIEFEVVLCTRDKTYVEVYVKETNIGDQLIEKDFAKRLEFFHSGSGFTSHINSLDDFYIQLEDDQLKLDAIGSILDRADGKFEKIVNPKVGDIVAAKFCDDECWYRAVIEEIESNGKFEVKFIDFGNLSETKEIGILDQSITELPRLSKHCRLSKPKNLINFSEAAEKKFQEISSNGATILQVNVVKPGDVTEVEIFCDGKNIIDILTPLCSIHNDHNDDF